MRGAINFHEQFRREKESPPKPASTRSFGYSFAGLFAIIGFGPVISSGSVHLWAVTLAAVFLGVTLILPRMLAPLLRVWVWIGFLLHKIMNPVLLALIFYGAVLPTGVIMRTFGRRPLRLDMDLSAKSYWIDRNPPGPQPWTMNKQF